MFIRAWTDRPFLSIRRSDVATLLDHVQDNHSARQADYVLNVVRSIMNWYATRNDDYMPPIARGMRRQNPGAQARARILDDDEIRSIWKPAEANGTFGAIIRMCLLTAQRRTKVAAMRWSDITVDGEWTIPNEAREKDAAGTLLLPEIALKIIRAQPRLGDNPYIFAGRGDGPFRRMQREQGNVRRQVGRRQCRWVLHDLRRSARRLMCRAGVRPDIAERVLGHAIAGVEGVYDRHSYRDEKADALRRLAGLLETIRNPPKGNVRSIREAAR